MKLKLIIAACFCGMAFLGLTTTETYVDIPQEKTDFWDTRSHGGVTVDTTVFALATFASGSATAAAEQLGEVETPLWFVPFSYFSFFTPGRPLDSRDPTGFSLFIR